MGLLRMVEIGISELQMVRDCAYRFVDSTRASVVALKPRVLPIALAHYMLDALSITHNNCQGLVLTTCS